MQIAKAWRVGRMRVLLSQHLRGTLAVLLGLLAAVPATYAETVHVSLETPQSTLMINEATFIHVFLEIENGQPGNGVFAYAFNLLESLPSVVDLVSVELLGEPNPLFTSSGTVNEFGLHDVYGGDGGFFLDPNRGVNGAFEVLTLEIVGQTPGTTDLFAEQADLAQFVGVPGGVLLQAPGNPDVDFTNSITITVIPEPSSLGFGVMTLAAFLFGRNRKSL